MLKNDLLLILGLLLAALCFFVAYRAFAPKDNSVVSIKKDNALYGEYSLYEDRTIDIDGHNVVVISSGHVFMEQADCPDKLCVHQGRISDSGGTIICLPNRVVVQIKGVEGLYDAISK